MYITETPVRTSFSTSGLSLFLIIRKQSTPAETSRQSDEKKTMIIVLQFKRRRGLSQLFHWQLLHRCVYVYEISFECVNSVDFTVLSCRLSLIRVLHPQRVRDQPVWSHFEHEAKRTIIRKQSGRETISVFKHRHRRIPCVFAVATPV